MIMTLIIAGILVGYAIMFTLGMWIAKTIWLKVGPKWY